MARQVRDTRLETREARARLKAAAKPYWRLLVAGRHLGYYKGPQGGKWVARIYQGSGKYLEQTLGLADDHIQANGETVLSYAQAHAKAAAILATKEEPHRGPYTVADAMQDYLAWFAVHRKSLTTTRQAIEAHILPTLGEKPVADLTPKVIRCWHETIARAAPRLRTARFDTAFKVRETADPRARKSTANRVLTILKAALNHAWREGKTPNDDAWRKVAPFRGVDSPKINFLNEAECVRLLNACTPDFRPLVQAALLTGCRYGELTRLVCGDYHPDAGTVLVRESKSGKPRHVPLTDEGRRLFGRLTLGRAGGETLFLRDDGKPWGTSHQHRPISAACARAGIHPAASFHVLRHTYGSWLAMRGVPLQVIAEALGHADTRITSRHYAHLMPSYVADTIRAHLPGLGLEQDNVVNIQRGRSL